MTEIHTYSEQSDFPGGKANLIKLNSEIVASTGIVTELKNIDYTGQKPQRTISLVFVSSLSPSEKLVLDGNTTNPAGGLISQHNHNFSIFSKEVMLGNPFHYTFSGMTNAKEVQYTQIFLRAGSKISEMGTFLTTSQNNKKIRMGVYNQKDPLDLNGKPNNKVAETSLYNTQPTDTGKVLKIQLQSEYIVPTDGYYYIAHITGNSSLQWAVSSSVRIGLLPVYWESLNNTNLPEQANGTSKVAGIIYASAIVEK